MAAVEQNPQPTDSVQRRAQSLIYTGIIRAYGPVSTPTDWDDQEEGDED